MLLIHRVELKQEQSLYFSFLVLTLLIHRVELKHKPPKTPNCRIVVHFGC